MYPIFNERKSYMDVNDHNTPFQINQNKLLSFKTIVMHSFPIGMNYKHTNQTLLYKVR